MDLQPSVCCEYCDKKQWKETIVNTASRIDLFTGLVCKKWRGCSTCGECGMVTYWHIVPDEPYEPLGNGKRK